MLLAESFLESLEQCIGLEISVFFGRASCICSKCFIESGLFCLTQFLKYSGLMLIKDLILLLLLLMILNIAFVRVEPFSSALLSKNGLSLSNPSMSLDLF